MWVDYKPVDVEIDDDNTGNFHVFEMRIGMHEFDHRIFYHCLSISNTRKIPVLPSSVLHLSTFLFP